MRRDNRKSCDKLRRDPFAFSLGGMRVIAPIIAPTAIADDQLDRGRLDCGECAPRPCRANPGRPETALCSGT